MFRAAIWVPFSDGPFCPFARDSGCTPEFLRRKTPAVIYDWRRFAPCKPSSNKGGRAVVQARTKRPARALWSPASLRCHQPLRGSAACVLSRGNC